MAFKGKGMFVKKFSHPGHFWWRLADGTWRFIAHQSSRTGFKPKSSSLDLLQDSHMDDSLTVGLNEIESGKTDYDDIFVARSE